jgi:hypothetical protein
MTKFIETNNGGFINADMIREIKITGVDEGSGLRSQVFYDRWGNYFGCGREGWLIDHAATLIPAEPGYFLIQTDIRYESHEIHENTALWKLHAIVAWKVTATSARAVAAGKDRDETYGEMLHNMDGRNDIILRLDGFVVSAQGRQYSSLDEFRTELVELNRIRRCGGDVSKLFG